MKNVAEIIKKLQNTSGTNDKIAILKSNIDNELLKKVLYYTYNSLMVYKITKESLMKTKPGTLRHDNIFDLLDELERSNICTSLRESAVAFVQSQDEDIQWLLQGMLLKDLDIQLGEITINKAFPKLIPSWRIQQAHPFDKVKKFKPNEWYCLALKLNGIRSTYYIDGFKSRQNQPMEGYSHVIGDLQVLCEHHEEQLSNWVFDGELIHKNRDYKIEDNENFRLTCSIVNSHATEKPDIEFVIFDMLPTSEFNTGTSTHKYKQRLARLKRIQKSIDTLGLVNIRIAPVFYEGYGVDEEVINRYLDGVSKANLEGLMLLRDEPYKCIRNTGILKLKRFYYNDVKIIGYTEGKDKLEGMLGSFVVDYKGFPCGVGSGFNPDIELRQLYWGQRDDLIGRVITVKCKGESKNKKGELSMQFPTFQELREEGKEVSYES